ncbi:MAG: DNA polymerase III subunit epsilon [Stutzerimonas stutzeri]|nr:MAG: DNA polymerase III subunit epsilon [Stutzerimonas stutzeri]
MTASPNAIHPAEIARHIEALEATGDFAIFKRLHPDRIPLPELPFETLGAETFRGCFIDVESTGVDHDSDEVFEFAGIAFTATHDGHIISVEEPVSWFNEPAKPIPDEVVELTGVTNEMVRGHRFEEAQFARLLEGVDLVIAHVSRFDRTFCERLHPKFADIAWACSQSQVAWRKHGHDSTKLSNLALAHGYVYGAHRAANDCAAGIAVLSRELKGTNAPALKQLLQNGLTESYKVFAIGAPFDKKDILKARQYDWSDGTRGTPKTWWKEIPSADYEAEMEFLKNHIFNRGHEVPAKRITPKERFSRRA